MFMRPGTSHIPSARITSNPSGIVVPSAGPTAVMRPSVITTAASCTGGPPSRSTTDAPTMAVCAEPVVAVLRMRMSRAVRDMARHGPVGDGGSICHGKSWTAMTTGRNDRLLIVAGGGVPMDADGATGYVPLATRCSREAHRAFTLVWICSIWSSVRCRKRPWRRRYGSTGSPA